MRQADEICSAPLYERHLVSRTRLLRKLERVEARTVLVTAPAGYGKTTLARQWVERAGGAWLAITTASCDVPVLARELTRALSEICQIDPRRVELALSAKSTALEQAKAVARATLDQVPAPVEGWLVIDDYQLLVPSQAAEELLAILERTGRFKLLVTSRERPRWVTPRRLVHLEVLELGADELALDDEETAELLPLSNRTAALREQARGWPAVIALAAHADRASVPTGAAALSSSLYDYFADELFERSTEPAQRCLTSIALLPALDPAETAGVLQEADAAALVLSTGLAHRRDGLIEVHPLAREFLLTKAHARPDASALARDGIDLLMSKNLWDETFELIKEFAIDDMLERLIAASFSSLIETGRIATLEAFGRYAAGHGPVSQNLLDLIEAEVALRDGAFDRAIALGKSAADGLPASDPLKARGYCAAGLAAQQRYELETAFELHALAATFAVRANDFNDSLWGKCLAALFLEHGEMGAAMREFETLPVPRAEDRLRMFTARYLLARVDSGFYDLRTDETPASQLLALITNPWVRTGWGNMYGYSLMLQARYAKAHAVLVTTLNEIDEFGLSFGRPHVEGSLAAADLGLRHFARCDSRLRRLERHVEETGDFHVDLNARALRARLYLSQQLPAKAVEATADDFKSFPTRAMYGEYLATRALSLAAAGDAAAAREIARKARQLTNSVETRVLCAAADAIVETTERGAADAAERLLATAADLGTWDGVVCAARASAALAQRLAEIPRHRTQLGSLLVRSNDAALAKRIGFVTRSRPTHGVLSARELEVLNLFRQGYKNSEIASMLFISSSTVKVHVQHIFDKLGARTRAEAVARYAEIETG